jgi:hypothetical protein
VTRLTGLNKSSRGNTEGRLATVSYTACTERRHPTTCAPVGQLLPRPCPPRLAAKVATTFLFLPDEVERVLADAPTVAALLPEPSLEGRPSDAFPALRKTGREVYRWIANTHYAHLAEAVALLERVHAAGCRFDGLLRTRSHAQFVGYTGELLVADDLIRRGYAVTTVARSAQAAPDLHVIGDGIDIAVEVYTPRELRAVDEWIEEAKDLVHQVDLPANFRSRLETRIDETVPWPERPDPWEVDAMLRRTHDNVLAAIARDVGDHLERLQPLDGEYRHEGTPLVTIVELTDVQEAAAIGPTRAGSISAPGFSGYSPAGVFATVVDRAKRKAAKGQTHGVHAALRALVVNIAQTKIAEDLNHPAHMDAAEAALHDFEPRKYGLDAIAFVARVVPHGLAAMLYVVDDDRGLTVEQVQALFAQQS